MATDNEEVKEEVTEEAKKEVEIRFPDDYETLKETVAKLEKNNQALMKEKVDARKAAESAALEAAKAGGDVEAVEKSWQEKYSKKETETSEEITGLRSMVNNLTVGATGQSIAAKIALKPEYADVLMPHVQSRLKMEMIDGKPVTRVLDKSGKLSALNIAELTEELNNDPRFAAIVIGSKAGGGGQAGDGVGSDSLKMKRSKFDLLSPAESKQFFKKGGQLLED